MDTMREGMRERMPRKWFQWHEMASFKCDELERAGTHANK
jgi:hypothetical protein